MRTPVERLFVTIAACLAATLACESNTEVPGSLTYAGSLSGSRERPDPVTATSGTGQAVMVVYSTGTMSYSVTWQGLTGAAIGAHIHGPADSNGTAGVLIDFSALPAGSTNQAITLGAAGSASGTVPVTASDVMTPGVSGDSLQRLLAAGMLYVNVHTAANPNGEIRANLKKQ